MECHFELSFDEPKLYRVAFGSQSNLPYEVNYHSFIGEFFYGHWSIAHNRRYLWGNISIGFTISTQLIYLVLMPTATMYFITVPTLVLR